MRTYGTKNSLETLVNYTQPKKKLVTAEEKARNRKTLKSYYVTGGNENA